MERLGHLHYEVRKLSSQCRPARTTRVAYPSGARSSHDRTYPQSCANCEGAFFAAGKTVALCTCTCHPFNRAEAEVA